MTSSNNNRKQRLKPLRMASISHQISIISTLILSVNCLNIDTLFPVVITPQSELTDQSFGHSVLMYRNDAEVQFLIGAPKDQTNGAIYKCSLGTSGSRRIPCFRQTFDRLKVDNISMNFGANLLQAPTDLEAEVSPDSGHFLTCAHSQAIFCNENLEDSYGFARCDFDPTSIRGRFTKALPVGVCYIFDKQNKIKLSIKPFTTWEHFYIGQENYLSHSFMGFSSAFSSTGNGLFLGVPGLNEFAGGAYRYPVPNYLGNVSGSTPEDDFDVEILPKSYDNNELLEKLYGQETRRIVMSNTTKERLSNHYAGYSMGVAKFWKDSDKECLIVGAPKRALAGAVDVYDQNLDRKTKSVRQTLIGSLSGEYFGASVLVLDLNGDDSQDLIVGSPNFWNGSRGFEDQGKATVFLWDPNVSSF